MSDQNKEPEQWAMELADEITMQLDEQQRFPRVYGLDKAAMIHAMQHLIANAVQHHSQAHESEQITRLTTERDEARAALRQSLTSQSPPEDKGDFGNNDTWTGPAEEPKMDGKQSERLYSKAISGVGTVAIGEGLELSRRLDALESKPTPSPQGESVKPIQTAQHHVIERTSAKGQSFEGSCLLCGKTGLGWKDRYELCDNPRGVLEDEALIKCIDIKASTPSPSTLGVEIRAIEYPNAWGISSGEHAFRVAIHKAATLADQRIKEMVERVRELTWHSVINTHLVALNEVLAILSPANQKEPR